MQSITFRIDEYWKGIKGTEIDVQSAPVGCGIHAHVGDRFLIYAFTTERGDLETGMCTSPYADTEFGRRERRALGPGKKPRARH